MPSERLFDKFRHLTRLLTHKVNKTLPATASSIRSLNSQIRQAMKDIDIDPRYDEEDEGFPETVTELKGLVREWGAEGGTTMEDRAMLALVMKDLLEMLGFKRRVDSDG